MANENQHNMENFYIISLGISNKYEIDAIIIPSNIIGEKIIIAKTSKILLYHFIFSPPIYNYTLRFNKNQ